MFDLKLLVTESQTYLIGSSLSDNQCLDKSDSGFW